MRTTIRMNEQLLAEAKLAAARAGRSLTALIEDAVRAALARQPAGRRRRRVRLTTVRGRGPRSGIDLDRTAALLDVLDRADGPD
jgi:hypothetical protein